MAKPTPTPILGSHSLQRFLTLIAAGPPEAEVLEPILEELERERRLEHAWLLLKQARLDPLQWGGTQARLRALVERGRGRRMGLWQTDPNRRTLRLRFEVREPASGLHPAGLLALLARTLMEAGLPVAVGLEKSPRPAAHLGHPLPPLAEGLSEWADVVLLEASPMPLAELPEQVNAFAPPGLRLLQCQQVPNYASKVEDLCRRAHWRWHCPDGQLDAARERMAAFLASDRFPMARTGKVGGQKVAREVDIRPLLEDCRWEGSEFLFETRITPGEAGNPLKLLAGILGQELAGAAVTRTGIDLADDPRLLQADKFEPKLHNMFEDAVLLGAGGNVVLVDDDDDEPLRLG